MPQRRNIPDDNDIILGQNLLSNDGDSVFDIILDLESGKVSTTDDVGADAAVAGNGGDDEFAKSILEDAAAEKAAEKAEKPVEITENAAEIAENAGETPDIIGETAEKTGEGSADNEIPGGEDVSAEEESSGEDGISDEEDISAEDASGGDLPDAEGDDFQDIGGEELPDIGDDELQETGEGKLPETGDDELPDIAEEDGGLFDDNITEESVPAKDAPADAGQESAVLAALIDGKGEPAEADGTNGGIFVSGGVADKAPDNAADAAEDLRKAPEDGTNGAPGEKSPEDLKTEEDSRALRALIKAAEGRNEPGADTVNTDKLNELATEMDESREYAGSGAKLRNILGLSMPDSNGSKTIGGITHGMWAIIILLVFLADVILINFVVSRLVYPAVSAVMNETGAASLKLATYETLYTGISYGIAFLAGGLIVFLISKIAQILMEEVGAENPGTVIKAALLIAVAIFAVGGIAAMLITRKGIFTVTVYRWICPMAAYAGGVLFFAVSGIGGRKKNR